MALYSNTKAAIDLIDNGLDTSMKMFVWYVQEYPNQSIFTAEEVGFHGPRLKIFRILATHEFGRWNGTREMFQFSLDGEKRRVQLTELMTEIRKLKRIAKTERYEEVKKVYKPKRIRKKVEVAFKLSNNGDTTLNRKIEAQNLPLAPTERIEIPAPMSDHASSIACFAHIGVCMRAEGFSPHDLDGYERSVYSSYVACGEAATWWDREHLANVDDVLFHALISNKPRRRKPRNTTAAYKRDIVLAYKNDYLFFKDLSEDEGLAQSTVSRWVKRNDIDSVPMATRVPREHRAAAPVPCCDGVHAKPNGHADEGLSKTEAWARRQPPLMGVSFGSLPDPRLRPRSEQPIRVRCHPRSPSKTEVLRTRLRRLARQGKQS